MHRMICNQQKQGKLVCVCVCVCVLLNADLEQQEAGQVTCVGGFFALEKNYVYISTEYIISE